MFKLGNLLYYFIFSYYITGEYVQIFCFLFIQFLIFSNSGKCHTGWILSSEYSLPYFSSDLVFSCNAMAADLNSARHVSFDYCFMIVQPGRQETVCSYYKQISTSFLKCEQAHNWLISF